jgi:hypothetical protein
LQNRAMFSTTRGAGPSMHWRTIIASGASQIRSSKRLQIQMTGMPVSVSQDSALRNPAYPGAVLARLGVNILKCARRLATPEVQSWYLLLHFRATSRVVPFRFSTGRVFRVGPAGGSISCACPQPMVLFGRGAGSECKSNTPVPVQTPTWPGHDASPVTVTSGRRASAGDFRRTTAKGWQWSTRIILTISSTGMYYAESLR